MKSFALLGFVSLVFCQYVSNQAGQTVLVAPKWAPQIRFAGSTSLPRTKFVRSWSPETTIFQSLPKRRVVRSWAMPVTQNVHNQEFHQQRIVRTPISKTVTVLPNEVTHITRNIKTHMPMVHERLRQHYSIEDINKKNIVHHYIAPVQDNHLGTRTGRSNQLGAEHVLYRNRVFNPLHFANEQGGEDFTGDELVDDLDTDFDAGTGTHWQVMEAESCEGLAAGQVVRPMGVCVCDGGACNNDNCNHLAFPDDIVC